MPLTFGCLGLAFFGFGASALLLAAAVWPRFAELRDTAAREPLEAPAGVDSPADGAASADATLFGALLSAATAAAAAAGAEASA